MPDIISYAVRLYYRFNFRRVVTAIYTRRLRRKHRGFGDTFYIDEVFVRINGKHHYLWRAVDQGGAVVDV